MKRNLCLATALPATALVVLAACSSSGGKSSASSPGATFGSGATGVVHFWARSATDKVAKQMVADFNASHPNLKVELTETQINQAVTKLGTAIRAGSPPDVIGLNDINMPIFTHVGSFMDLTKYINQLPNKSSLSPGHLGLATYQSKLYGVPYLADLSVLWYNKKLFTQAGLDPNKPPTNFAEILSDAQKINALGNGINGFTFAGNCQGCLGFTMLPNVWAVQQPLIKGEIPNQTASVKGNDALKRTLQLYQDLWSQHLVPASARTENGTTWGKDFTNGKVGLFPGSYGISIGSGAGLPASIASDLGVTPLPGPDGQFSTFDGGDDFAIPNGAKNASGAWEFIQFVLQNEEQLKYPDLGFTPVRTDLLTDTFKKQHPFDAVALQALTKGYAPTTLAYNEAFNASGSPWFKMFSTAVYDGDVDGALSSGQSDLTSALKDSGSAS
jgi:multiple sugar transport system substrate-binding protein